MDPGDGPLKRVWSLGLLLAACPSALEPEPPLVDAGPARAIDWAPEAFGGRIPSPERNPMTAAGVALGRRLFYDPSLSSDGEVACATCHTQRRAFSDGIPLGSDGVSGNTLPRHAPVLQNLAWADQGLFWDGGASDLESLVLAPLTDPDEMAADAEPLMQRLALDPAYQAAFEAAFDDGVTLPNFMRAIAQFLRSLVSWDSPYDQWLRGERPEAPRGLAVFEAHCARCHPPPFFTDHGFHNIGLDSEFPAEFEHPQRGRARISEAEADLGAYKTPSLRNLQASKPYLHDGRLWSLRQVLERYRSGVLDSASLDAAMRRPDGALGLALSDADLDDLEAFLETLADPSFLNRPEHGEP